MDKLIVTEMRPIHNTSHMLHTFRDSFHLYFQTGCSIDMNRSLQRWPSPNFFTALPGSSSSIVHFFISLLGQVNHIDPMPFRRGFPFLNSLT
jgi:hypothetical protein